MQKTASLLDKKCLKHLAAEGITSIQKLQHQLQKIFEKADHQNSALIGIYKLILPEWNRIERLEGFPEVGQEMWQYICNLFIDFDQRHHPKVLSGGLWINSGFSSSADLGPWEINLDHCNVIYK